MNYDDPKLTAYALGEGDEVLELDVEARRVVEETAIVAGVLSTHYRRPRRARRVMRYAMAASVIVLGFAIFVLSQRSNTHQTIAVLPVQQPAQVWVVENPILRLTPAMAESTPSSALINANFRGIHSVDVEQLVAAVIVDASRVGSFTSLRLTPEAALQ